MDYIKKKILRYEYVGFIVMLGLFILFNFLPKLKESARLGLALRRARSAVKTVTKEEKEEQIRQRQNQLKQIKSAAVFLNDEVSRLKASIPENKNVPMLTLEIEDLAGAAKIELASVKPTPDTESQKGDYRILPIEIGFQSTYGRLVDFVDAVESSSELLTVQGFHIIKDEMAYPLLDVRLTISVLLKETGEPQDVAPTPLAEGDHE